MLWLKIPTYLILADLAWIALTQVMWAIDAVLGETYDETRPEDR